jgi:ribosomal protein S1
VLAGVKGVNVFIPASQLDNKYVEDLSAFMGMNIRIKITEFDSYKRKIVGSRRVVLDEEQAVKKKELLDNIEAGQILSGKVSRAANFGVFVDLGGIDGLIHISELSWSRVKNPTDIVKIGDTVDVYVVSVDKEKERISLSLRKTTPEPWDNIENKLQVGDIISGKVVRLAPFGAFVEIEPGLDGLVHISQISEKRVNKIEDELKVGDTISAKVVELNPGERRLSLSIRQAHEEMSADTDQDKITGDTTEENQEPDTLTIGDVIKDKNINQ